MDNWAKEPWRVGSTYSDHIHAGEELIAIALKGVEPHEEEEKANALRIVTCVNACEGISSSALESGVLKEVAQACKYALSDLKWIETQDIKSNFQSSITLLQAVLDKLEGGK